MVDIISCNSNNNNGGWRMANIMEKNGVDIIDIKHLYNIMDNEKTCL